MKTVEACLQPCVPPKGKTVFSGHYREARPRLVLGDALRAPGSGR